MRATSTEPSVTKTTSLRSALACGRQYVWSLRAGCISWEGEGRGSVVGAGVGIGVAGTGVSAKSIEPVVSFAKASIF